ncbi:hypothetical protein LTR10_004968 [Elasticomyces elasticus]|uniref:Carboxymuconolactone decarboxylase-like domain-containing protein n=1 Tax=Elasticomyces elasticus TaxID=574655 RepID=A0AAN8A367_9PEZI|nr:hypothetical protein LTR10_004968 [Elasticomyces elasticus]KAK4977280.1 hypothetical protein LTR42_003330 [Elasticomyces elasticus]KAK5701457.1 hypothetical protein LTR97_004270 [Elasticomyces elasticus]
MRIPYAPKEPQKEADAPIYDRILARRSPRPLIPLDLALLHNPAIADGYSSLMGAIRTQSSFPLELAELAICYVAVLNGAVYEWTAHAPIALKAGARREVLGSVLEGSWRWKQGSDGGEKLVSDDEEMVLEFTEQSTENVKVEEGLMERLKGRWTDQQVMELVITVGGYNMVSRFLVALDVTESNGKEMKMPAVEA